MSQKKKKDAGGVQLILLLLFHKLWYLIKTMFKKITTHKVFIDNFNHRKKSIPLHNFLYVRSGTANVITRCHLVLHEKSLEN